MDQKKVIKQLLTEILLILKKDKKKPDTLASDDK